MLRPLFWTQNHVVDLRPLFYTSIFGTEPPLFYRGFQQNLKKVSESDINVQHLEEQESVVSSQHLGE